MGLHSKIRAELTPPGSAIIIRNKQTMSLDELRWRSLANETYSKKETLRRAATTKKSKEPCTRRGTTIKSKKRKNQATKTTVIEGIFSLTSITEEPIITNTKHNKRRAARKRIRRESDSGMEHK